MEWRRSSTVCVHYGSAHRSLVTHVPGHFSACLVFPKKYDFYSMLGGSGDGWPMSRVLDKWHHPPLLEPRGYLEDSSGGQRRVESRREKNEESKEQIRKGKAQGERACGILPCLQFRTQF